MAAEPPPLPWPSAASRGGSADMVERFDAAVAAIAEEVINNIPEGRAALEGALRAKCSRLIDEQLQFFRERRDHRERLAAQRQEEKSRNARRVAELREQHHRTATAKLTAKLRVQRSDHRRAVTGLMTRGERALSYCTVQIVFLQWRNAALQLRTEGQKQAPSPEEVGLAASKATNERSARRRQVSGQENNPPQNGGAIDAPKGWGIPGQRPRVAPPPREPGDVRPLQSSRFDRFVSAPAAAPPARPPVHLASEEEVATQQPAQQTATWPWAEALGYTAAAPQQQQQQPSWPPPLRQPPPWERSLGTGPGVTAQVQCQVGSGAQGPPASSRASSPEVTGLRRMPSSRGASPPRSPPSPALTRRGGPGGGSTGRNFGAAAVAAVPLGSAPLLGSSSRPSPRSSPMSHTVAMASSASTVALWNRSCPMVQPHAQQVPVHAQSACQLPLHSSGSFGPVAAPLGPPQAIGSGSCAVPSGQSGCSVSCPAAAPASAAPSPWSARLIRMA